MNISQLNLLIKEAKEFIANNEGSEPQSNKWYAIGNFRKFINSIESIQKPEEMEKAIHALRYHISDQFEWSKDYCKAISDYCEKVDAIRKGMLTRYRDRE